MTAVPARAPALSRPAPGAGRKTSNTWTYVLLVGGLVLMVGPFLWMVLGSIKPEADFLQSTPTLLPSAPTTNNYSRLFEQLDFPRFFFNSSVIALAVTVGNLVKIGRASCRERV